MQNLRSKLRIDKAIAQAESQEVKDNLWALYGLLKDWLALEYETASKDDDGRWKSCDWEPSKLRDVPGIYVVVYSNGKKKIGMSFSCKLRVDRQPHTRAVIVMALDKVIQHVPQGLVEKIKRLRLPGLTFNKDHEGKDGHFELLVKLQLCELKIATMHRCATNTVGERFFQMPSLHVRRSIASPKFSKKAIAFMTNIQDNGVFCLFTWPTLKARLHEMKLNSEFLQHILRDLPNREFVKLFWIMELLGPKFGAWEDSLKTSPREAHLHEVVQRIVNADSMEELRDALALIQGENYGHYVPPSDSDLAEGARIVLEEKDKSLPPEHAIMMERITFNALEEHQPVWFDSVIDMKSAIKVMPDRALLLVRTKRGRRIIVTSSFFTAFAENTKTVTRFRAIQAYLTCLSLLCESGNVSAEEVSRQRSILRSFLMGLEGLKDDNESSCDDNHRSARRCAMTEDFFKGPKPGILVVSKNLEIGCHEMCYLRACIGEAWTNELLKAHGLLANGGSSPLEPDWKCPGPPAAPGIAAEECNAITNEGTQSPRATMFIGTGSEHPYYGSFSCPHCRRKFQRRELAILKEWERTDILTDEKLQERLQVLREKVVEQQVRDKVRRGNVPSFKKNQNTKNRQNQKHARDPEEYKKSLKKQRVKDATQKAKGKVKKQGFNRCFRNTKLYPAPFMELLTQAATKFAQVVGEPLLSWNGIITLFDAIIKKEDKTDGLLDGIEIKYMTLNGEVGDREEGKPRYLENGYRTALRTILTRGENKKSDYQVLDFNEETASAARLQVEAVITAKVGEEAKADERNACLIQHVIERLYSESD
jgi:hypothetical protein